jgi:hypothetical protein
MAKAPMVNIERLKNDNREGQTQRELKAEIFEAARRDGRDISQVRGRRLATHYFDFESDSWVEAGASHA